MATDNFIGWDLDEKMRMLRALQEARLTGRIKEAMTSHGVRTSYDISQTNITQLMRELECSIAIDPQLPADSPFRAGLLANTRTAMTRTSHY